MLAEVLGGMALLKSGVDFVKSNIDTVNDVKEIFGHVEKVLNANDNIQKARSKKAQAGITDQLGLDSVAQEVIDAKLAKEHIDELRIIIDNRFGPGTWQEIVTLRAKRKKEERLKREREAQERLRRKIEREETMNKALKIFLYIFCFFGLLILWFVL